MIKLKVVHVLVLQKMAGSQVVSLNILKSLPCEQFDKYIIFGGEKNENFEQYFERFDIKVLYAKNLDRAVSFNDFKAFFELYKLFKYHKFSIVHTHSTKPAILGRIAAKIAGVKNIFHTVHGVSFHSYEGKVKRAFYYFCEIFSALFGDMNFIVNKYYTHYYPSILIKSKTIYNGVDFSSFNIDINENKDVINVGYFARLDQAKDPVSLILSINEIRKKKLNNKPFHCYIAGDGEYKDECVLLVSKLNLSNYITFFGWIDNKSDFFNKIDILCQPSIYEAFGLSIVEAAYFSIPCVSTNVEGIPEVIIDGKTGLLSKPKDIDLISQNISKLINDDVLRSKMGREAKIFANQNFTVENMTDKYLIYYQKINKSLDVKLRTTHV